MNKTDQISSTSRERYQSTRYFKTASASTSKVHGELGCFGAFALTLMMSFTACESPPQKSLDNQDWTEFGIYEVYLDQGSQQGGDDTIEAGSPIEAGEIVVLDDYDVAGQEIAGQEIAGQEIAGQETAGQETAGQETAGQETAGQENIIIEDPLLSFSEATIPTNDQVAIWDGSGGLTLWWVRGSEIWMSQADENHQLGAPKQVYDHNSPLTKIHLSALTQSAYLVIEDQEKTISMLTLGSGVDWGVSPLTALRLPLSGEVRVSSYEDQMVIIGNSDELSLLSWIIVNEGDAFNTDNQDALHHQLDVRFAPVDWPMPSSIGWVSGQAVLRFDSIGECVYLSPLYNVNGSAPCLSSSGYFLNSSSETTLLMLDESGALKATIASSPNEEASYLIAQVELDDQVTEGKISPLFGPFRGSQRQLTFLGRSYDDSSEEGLKSRLIVAEPQGLWFSENAWSEWPFPHVKASVRRGEELWLYVFDETNAPRRVRAPLQVNTFNERTPYGLSFDTSCRPTVERCDELDNNCDGIIDNGLCCANGRSPYEGYFIPSATPREFFVTDVENADASRYAVRVADDRWEIWAIYYGASSRNLVSFGTIEGAYNAIGFTAAGGYSVLVAQDAEGTWKAFWNHSDPNASLKAPETLGCEQVLAMSNVGNLTTSSSPAVICNDRVVHLRADRDEDDVLLPADTYIDPFQALPNIEWATFIRHNSRGESSMIIAFQSLAGDAWEVSKISVAKGVGNSLSFGVPQSLNSRLDINAFERPHPIYLHRDDSPGFPGSLPFLEIDEDNVSARVNIPRDNNRVWNRIHFGAPVDQIRYSELPSKVVASASHQDGRGVDFYVLDFKNHERLTPWVTKPTFSWRSPLSEEQGTPNEDQGVPDEAAPFRWSMIHGNYYNYIATLFEAGNVSIDGANLPRGVWTVRLYSVTNCVR